MSGLAPDSTCNLRFEMSVHKNLSKTIVSCSEGKDKDNVEYAQTDAKNILACKGIQ